jgi:hypothetical protein
MPLSKSDIAIFIICSLIILFTLGFWAMAAGMAIFFLARFVRIYAIAHKTNPEITETKDTDNAT